ncbi:MAG: aspartate aminotransferase family protein [Beijerinckiaceae bacterium]
MLTNLQTRDVETLIHPYTNLDAHRTVGPLVLEQAKGIYVYDVDGKPYIEGMAGLWCASLGYGNEELVQAAADQMRKLSFTHLFSGRSHDPAIELAERLKEMAPIPVSKVFFGTSGSDANDTQMKLVWYMNNALGRPKKKKIISRLKGYHGVSIASASLTGLPNNHIDFDLPIAGVLHTSCPHHYRFAQAGETEEEFATRLANELEEMIVSEGPDTVAAFIAEPVMGAGGVIVPPKTYFPKIQAVLDKYDVLLISDEVICGFGRLGTMFGCETMQMKPDTMSLAKAITSSYQPLSAVLIPDRMYEAMLTESRKIGTFGHGNTYAGHPVAAAVANKTLEIYVRDNILGHVQSLTPLFQKRLKSLADHPLVGEARGVGLVGGIELVADKATKRAFTPKQGVAPKTVVFGQHEGVIIRAIGDTLAICPPLIITAAEVDEMFDRIARALDKAEEWVRKEGHRTA